MPTNEERREAAARLKAAAAKSGVSSFDLGSSVINAKVVKQ